MKHHKGAVILTASNSTIAIPVTLHDILDKINSDFQGFIAQKQNMIFNLKEMQKTFISQFEDLNMPNLSIYLNNTTPKKVYKKVSILIIDFTSFW